MIIIFSSKRTFSKHLERIEIDICSPLKRLLLCVLYFHLGHNIIICKYNWIVLTWKSCKNSSCSLPSSFCYYLSLLFFLSPSPNIFISFPSNFLHTWGKFHQPNGAKRPCASIQSLVQKMPSNFTNITVSNFNSIHN